MAHDDEIRRSAANSRKPALPSLPEFIACVVASGLLDEAAVLSQRELFCQEHSGTESTGHFARFLVSRGSLTRYQAERLLAGRSEGFFLGGCKLLGKLGAGGMGQVYLAEQTRLGRRVALKVLPRQSASDPVFVARFQREARAAAALKHPNIVQIHDVGEERGIHYLVMEHVKGETLATHLSRQGVFSCDDSIGLIRQIAAGLAHVHDSGIVHRDIKPSNLILEEGVVKILDLGLARQEEGSQPVTQEGQVFGTPDYMSPEQCTDARKADARSDLYSLGCTWFTLLTGRVPFPQESAVAKVMAHLQSPPPLDKLPRTVTPGVPELIGRLLSKRPEDRPPSASALIEELDRLDRIGAAGKDAPGIDPPKPLPAALVPTQLMPAVVVEAAGDPEGIDPESLVQRPTAGVPVFMLYLVPTMAALVLGGAYFGIDALRRQVERVEPVIIELPAQVEQAPPTREESLSAAPVAPTPSEPVQPPAVEPAVAAAGHRAAPLKEGAESLVPEATSPPRPAQTRGVRSTKEFEQAWSTAVDGDRLELSADAIFQLGSLHLEDRTLHIVASDRATVVVTPEAAHAKGLWRLERSSLVLSGIDVFVAQEDVPVPQAVLIDAAASDVRLSGCSITVVSSAARKASELTLVRISGERKVNPDAESAPPAAMVLEANDVVVRGDASVAEVASRLASVRMANVLVASSQGLLRVRHAGARGDAHDGIGIEISDCTLDVGGPLVEVIGHPQEPDPVRTTITMRRSLVADGGVSAEPAPQVFWASPVATETISNSLRWVGEANVLVRRGPGLVARTAEGPLMTLVLEPDDWQRQGLGLDAASAVVDRFSKLSRTPFDRRLPADYPTPLQIANLRGRSGKAPAGADVRRWTPESWVNVQRKLESRGSQEDARP